MKGIKLILNAGKLRKKDNVMKCVFQAFEFVSVPITVETKINCFPRDQIRSVYCIVLFASL